MADYLAELIGFLKEFDELYYAWFVWLAAIELVRLAIRVLRGAVE